MCVYPCGGGLFCTESKKRIMVIQKILQLDHPKDKHQGKGHTMQVSEQRQA